MRAFCSHYLAQYYTLVLQDIRDELAQWMVHLTAPLQGVFN